MTATTEKEGNRGVMRAMRILKSLKGHSLTGMTLRDISHGLREHESTVLRTLQSMAAEDAVIQLDSGRWALSVLALQIAAAHETEMSRASGRLAELQQRVRAGAHA